MSNGFMWMLKYVKSLAHLIAFNDDLHLLSTVSDRANQRCKQCVMQGWVYALRTWHVNATDFIVQSERVYILWEID